MDKQVKTLLDYLKKFRDESKIDDDEFSSQLANGIVDGEDDDPCLIDTFQDFRDLMRQTGKKIDARLLERHMRS